MQKVDFLHWRKQALSNAVGWGLEIPIQFSGCPSAITNDDKICYHRSSVEKGSAMEMDERRNLMVAEAERLELPPVVAGHLSGCRGQGRKFLSVGGRHVRGLGREVRELPHPTLVPPRRFVVRSCLVHRSAGGSSSALPT